MDPITHAISGVALARAFPKQALALKQVALLALIAMLPDADIVLRLFSDNIYLQHHRGLTHSLLMLPLWAWLIYSLSSRRMQKQPKLPWLIGGALLLHIWLDLITTYGTMILAPVSDWRAALDLIFIIDPLFTACLLLPLLLGLIWQRKSRLLAGAGFALMFCYLSLTFANQQQAIELTRKAHPDASAYAALPMAFSPFHWQLIAQYPDHYARAAVNLKPDFSGTRPLFDEAFASSLTSTKMTGPNTILWQELPAMHTVKAAKKLPGMAFYAWFTRYPVLLEQNENSIRFADLAFGGGAPGVRTTFQMQIDLNDAETNKPRAWLIWRANRKSEMTLTSAPFNWLPSE